MLLVVDFEYVDRDIMMGTCGDVRVMMCATHFTHKYFSTRTSNRSVREWG